MNTSLVSQIQAAQKGGLDVLPPINQSRQSLKRGSIGKMGHTSPQQVKILEPRAIGELRAKHQSAMMYEDNTATIEVKGLVPNLKAVVSSQISTIQAHDEYSDIKKS